MNSTIFLDSAPKFITNRFSSVNKYVWETLVTEQKLQELHNKFRTKVDRKKEIKRLKSICDEAATIVFLFLINKFFVEGSKAAKQAVDTFKDLDIEGFYIGINYFSERNAKVVQGDIISENLLSSIQDEKVKKLISHSSYVSEILYKYKKFI